MSELNRLAAPLLEHPVLPRAPVGELRKRATRRRHHRMIEAGSAAAVVLVAVVLVVTLLPSPMKARPSGPGSQLAAYISTAVSVPNSALEQAGLSGGAVSTTAPTKLTGLPPLAHAGKPAVVYVGAEYCPYCAVARWGLVVALSRFGEFSELGNVIASSSTDVYPGLKSWSFQGSHYSSPTVHFEAAETQNNQPDPSGKGYEPLDKLNRTERYVLKDLDSSKYDSALSPAERGAIPVIDFANRYLVVGASTDPAVLEGLSLHQIAADLSDPSSPAGQAIDQVANYYIAALCQITGASGDGACSLPVIQQAEASMSGPG